MTTVPTSRFRAVPHAEGDVHAVMGDPMRFIMTAATSGGAYALSEATLRPGNGAPPHIHHREDESFYVLEGAFKVVVDGQEVHARPGDFVHAPRGSVRSFTNVSDGPSRILILHVPGAAIGFYEAMGQLPFPPDPAALAALGATYDIELVAGDQ